MFFEQTLSHVILIAFFVLETQKLKNFVFLTLADDQQSFCADFS